MNSTRDLLDTITALRQRLEQAKNLADDAGSAAAEALQQHPHVSRLYRLRESVELGRPQQMLLQSALQQARPTNAAERLPQHLSAGALRSLQRISELLRQLRSYADESSFSDESDPVAAYYQDTVLLADLVLRTLKGMPESRTVQMRLCSSVDVLIGEIEQRVCGLHQIIERIRNEREQLSKLERLLKRLSAQRLHDVNLFFLLAEEIVGEIDSGHLLRFASPNANTVASAVSAHSLNTARVIARVAWHDSQWQSSLLQPVVAALVHDVGMLELPEDLLQDPDELDKDARGIIERHCRTGSHRLEEVAKNETWLIEAACRHHERLDGTGYPAGLLDSQISPLVRLLAVCDVYAACCAPRPYRPGHDSTRALQEVETMAQQGLLDQCMTSLLGRLGAYPAGSAVELVDGSCGMVIAPAVERPEEHHTSGPAVMLLTAKNGRALPIPMLVELGQSSSLRIARCIPDTERGKAFGSAYPHYIY